MCGCVSSSHMLRMTHQLFSLFLLFSFPLRTCIAYEIPPNPGYFPFQKFEVESFDNVYYPFWGQSHQSVDDNGVLSMLLNQSSGSGFKSKDEYQTYYIGADIKLPSNSDTAGLDISLYVSNQDDCSPKHDEIDIEFLGSIDGSLYHLQTNVIIKDHSTNPNSGGGENNIGREMTIKLWFDPTKDFHNYAFVKSDRAIIFFVDGYPIRRFLKRSGGAFPKLKVWAYGSIWDASNWATENGKYGVDYNAAPFIVQYRNFQLNECEGKACSVTGSGSLGLSTRQKNTMKWIHDNYLTYDYCKAPADDSLKSECSKTS